MDGMRLPLIWWWRVLLGGFAIAYLASGTLQLWVPPLLPFLAAVAVEAQFFVSGLRARERPPHETGPGPQQRDLDELGWQGPDADPERPEPASARPTRVRRRLVQAAFVLALFAGLFLLDRSRPSWRRLPAHERASTLAVVERQATRIAGHPATVICDTSGRRVGYVQEADGLAEVGGGRMWLTADVCYRLATVRRTHRGGTEAGHAIAVAAHEAWHLHGEQNEGIVNCYAYQSGVAFGRALGLSAGTARRLMHQQLADNPGDYAGSPAYVVPTGCHRGGDLDLRLDGTHFP
jgi:hypothetical protein